MVMSAPFSEDTNAKDAQWKYYEGLKSLLVSAA